MMKIQKQFNDIFRKHGVQNREVFHLGDTETVGPFINIANTVSSNQNEEVLSALVYYRDRKHRDDVVSKIQNDENYRSILSKSSRICSLQNLPSSLGNSVALKRSRQSKDSQEDFGLMANCQHDQPYLLLYSFRQQILYIAAFLQLKNIRKSSE